MLTAFPACDRKIQPLGIANIRGGVSAGGMPFEVKLLI